MDVEKNVAAAGGAEATRQEQARLLNKVWKYLVFLHISSVMVRIAPRLAPATRPAFVPSIPAGYGFPVTGVVFTAATMAVQEMLARVLERPARAGDARLIPEAAWSLAVVTCMVVSLFFRSYLCFGGDDYFLHGCDEWELVRAASALNIFIAACTVKDYLA